ncbi:hypothetical protein EV141_1581 [Microcella putealis]|uniref:Uncharacterized protein n=2 Tax=Microcella putealis TaxID=337005 RepID=A0A4Q7LQW7_9MICO|nr:hypothetical protein EV141_1581 [Microcella putealis]TQM23440.1 hypothetical protein BJ957_1803 [Microcella putealis]
MRCMIDEGWESRETDSGTIFGFPEGQETAFGESDARCSAASGQDAVIDGYSLSLDLLRAGYAAAVATHACIEAQGVTLSDPPSEQFFIESGGGWTPYLELDDELIETLLPLCPQP